MTLNFFLFFFYVVDLSVFWLTFQSILIEKLSKSRC